MKTHEANKIQNKAFDQVVKAVNRAKKLGLSFYGKQDTLVAYTIQADKYIRDNDLNRLLGTGNGEIPCLSATVLTDSGADDYPGYKTLGDENDYNPYKF